MKARGSSWTKHNPAESDGEEREVWGNDGLRKRTAGKGICERGWKRSRVSEQRRAIDENSNQEGRKDYLETGMASLKQ